MALGQSALLEVLNALRDADAADRIKQAGKTIYHFLGTAFGSLVLDVAAGCGWLDMRTNAIR